MCGPAHACDRGRWPAKEEQEPYTLLEASRPRTWPQGQAWTHLHLLSSWLGSKVSGFGAAGVESARHRCPPKSGLTQIRTFKIGRTTIGVSARLLRWKTKTADPIQEYAAATTYNGFVETLIHQQLSAIRHHRCSDCKKYWLATGAIPPCLEGRHVHRHREIEWFRGWSLPDLKAVVDGTIAYVGATYSVTRAL